MGLINQIYRLNKRIFFLILLIVYGGHAYAGELVIIESNNSTYLNGNIISSNDTIKLSDGDKISIISSSGSIHHLIGPFKGKLDDKSGKNSTLTNTIANFINSAATDSSSLGTFRNVSTKRSSIWRIKLSKKSSIQCAHPNKTTIKVKAKAKERDIILSNFNHSVEVKIPAKNKDIPWPVAEQIMIDGAEYDFKDKKKEYKFILHLYKGDNSDAHILAWMIEKECHKQANALLQKLTNIE